MSRKTLTCIGAGYVGGVTMAVIAEKCEDYKVIVTDVDAEKIKRWNTDDLPIYEPGLLETVKKARGRNLFFTDDVKSGIRDADIIFVSVNTPTKTFGEGAGKCVDLQYWEKTARDILESSDQGKIVVEKSTLPVKTAEAMKKILESNKKGLKYEVISNPEFLAEGSAIRDLEFPDRVLIGSASSNEAMKAREEVVEIYSHWVPKEKIFTSNIWSAELSKLISNAFLAQRISSINSITPLCEATGADISEISRAVGLDTRIGGKFLMPSVGFGGSCFKKDILNLVYICENYSLKETAEYWENVLRINEYQQERFFLKMLGSMFNTIAGKKIAVFGLAFKADTDDTRESPAIYIVKKLLAENAEVTLTDPKALRNVSLAFGDDVNKIKLTEDPYEAAEKAHAIAVVTEWDLYKKLDYKKIFDSMSQPSFIFDGRNILDGQKLFDIGFSFFSLGKPPLIRD
ncbi:nucleotide sugar dehydrogenase [candidate division WOR-3 bacterium]|nr:nucleotide sugar dehydrogenase [candidate division WOR-3 bacterium]